ncbi:hypothetical protein M2273_001481 [Mucilaginibacter lappiensis]
MVIAFLPLIIINHNWSNYDYCLYCMSVILSLAILFFGLLTKLKGKVGALY